MIYWWKNCTGTYWFFNDKILTGLERESLRKVLRSPPAKSSKIMNLNFYYTNNKNDRRNSGCAIWKKKTKNALKTNNIIQHHTTLYNIIEHHRASYIGTMLKIWRRKSWAGSIPLELINKKVKFTDGPSCIEHVNICISI